MSRFSNWAKRLQGQPSLLWLIERAPTIGMLEEFVATAVQCKDAGADTRHHWIEAAELRAFYLQRYPPKFEKVGVSEALGEEVAKDPRLKMTVEEVIEQVLELRHFKCVEDGIFEFTGLVGNEPLSKYFSRHRAQPSLEGNQQNQTHSLAEDETARALPSLVFNPDAVLRIKPRCPGCDDMGWITKPGAAYDPPEQEPCPVCGP